MPAAPILKVDRHIQVSDRFLCRSSWAPYGATQTGRSIFHVDMISYLSTGTVV